MKYIICALAISVTFASSVQAASLSLQCQGSPETISASAVGEVSSEDSGHGRIRPQGSVDFSLFSATGEVLYHNGQLPLISPATGADLWFSAGDITVMIKPTSGSGTFYRNREIVANFQTNCVSGVTSGPTTCRSVGHAIRCN